MRSFGTRLALGLVALVAFAPTPIRGDVQSGFGATSGGGLAAEDESFQTELFRGAATSSIPFLLPPGPNGFQPELGLRYDSQSGNGWVGRGWQLGVPAIERMTKYGAPTFRDDAASPDLFALSDDRLVRDDAGFYHATRENFARIERVEVRGIDHWLVHRTNGEKQWYGATVDSRIANAQGVTFRWLLSRSEDPNGNYVAYEYATTAETGDAGNAYLKRVSYSFAGDTALASATIRTVELTTAARPDPTIAFRAGIRIDATRRLDRVDVRYGGRLVSRYDLVYADEENVAPVSGASLLRRVRRIGADGASELPSDTFTYAGGTPPTWSFDPALSAALHAITLPTATGAERFNFVSGNWQLRDANGDAVPDVIGTSNDAVGFFHQTVQLNDRGAAGFRNAPIPVPGVLEAPAAISQEGTRLVDYDGDGKLDVVWSLATPFGWYYDVRWSYAYQWVPEPSPGFVPPVPMASFCGFGGGQGPNVGWTEIADVDGNGFPDLVHDRIPAPNCTGARSIREVYLNDGTGWQRTPDAAWSAALADAMTALGAPGAWALSFFDANGDGLADVALDANGDGAIDTGVVLLNTQLRWQSTGGFTLGAGHRPVDLNGDDLIDHASAPAWLNRGDGNGAAIFELPAGFGTPGPGKAFVDVDGDGLVDLVHADGTTTQVYRADAAAVDHLLVRIDRATGATVEIAYRPSSEGSCYDASGTGFDFHRSGCHADAIVYEAPGGSLASCTYPFLAWTAASAPTCAMPYELLPFAVQTVASVTVDDRNGNVRTDRARFTHGFFERADREFRGFGRSFERPETLTYVDPKYGGNVTLGALRVTQFYQYAFLRGEIAAFDLWSSADDRLDASDLLLERRVNGYAYTRGDLAGTYLLLGNAILNTGNALACDPTAPGAVPGCSLYDLAQDPYATEVALPSPLPFRSFQDAFCLASPSNPDCGYAYLVLPVASQTARYEAGTTTIEKIARWHDVHGNVQVEWNRGDAGDANDDRVTVREFASPGANAPSNFHALPKRTYRQSPAGAILEETRFDYDGLANGQVRKGRVTAIVQDLDDAVHGTANAAVTTTATYTDANAGLPSVVSDPFGPGETPRYTSYTYDAGRSFVTNESRGALAIATAYDPPGAPSGLGIAYTVADANGNRTSFGADAFGRPTDTWLPPAAGSTAPRLLERRAYMDVAGATSEPRLRTTTYDGNGVEVTVSQYGDGLGRTVRTTTTGLDENDQPATIRSDTRYDRLGRVAFQERPTLGASSGTSFFYDLRGREIYAVQPDGGVRETQHRGLETRHFDAVGNRSDVRRDGAGSVVAVLQYPTAGGSPQTTRYVYDALGRLKLVCAPLATACAIQAGSSPEAAVDPRHTILMQYDSLSRRVRIADPDRGVERFRFDGAGNPTRRIDARGAVVESTYDALGRPVRILETSAGSVDPIDVALRYGDQESSPPANSRGRLISVHENALERSFGYDALGRTIRVDTRFADSSRTWTTHHHYDLLGRETFVTHPDGEVVASRFDAMGLERLASPQRVYVADVRHDAEGRPRTIVYGNGDTRTLQYQATSGRLSSLAARRSGASTEFQRLGFTWDAGGRLTAINDSIFASESLANVRYDGVSRLLEATRNGQTLRFDYDTLGNLVRHEGVTQRFEHASKPHALHEQADAQRFRYDASGNLVGREGATLVYDALGRLIEHRAPGALRSFYAYDHGGERVRAARGADVSHFFGPDYEIKNGRRFVKTIRAEGTVVAQVSGPLPSQAAAAPWLGSAPIDPKALALGVAAVSILGALGAALARRGVAPAWRGSIASGLAVAILGAPATPALARKGDVRADDALTLADPLVVLRSLAGQSTLTPTQRADADVAPLSAGEPVGDQRVDAADAQALLRAATGADVDGDGLDGAREVESGTWPLDRDSDGDGVADGAEDRDADGVSNLAEIAAGTQIGDADSDDDGFVDGDDPSPLVAEGTLVAYVHADHLGSSAVLTDANGLVVRRTRYAPFGRVRWNAVEPGASASTLDPAPKFTGQLLDADTGLHYYGARWYDARFGRFVSPDAIVPDALDPQMLNRYAYVRNDPLARIDPSGHDPLWSYGVGDLAEESWDFYDDSDADFGDVGYDWDFEVESFLDTGYEWFSAGTFEGTSAWSLGMAESTYSYDTSPTFFERTTGFDFLSPAYTALSAWKTSSNLDALRTLEPQVAASGALHLTGIAEAGIPARITWAYRDYETQDDMYAKGRTVPGARVTNARGGQSWHNFRLAYDIAVFDSRGGYVTNGSDQRYLRVGEIGERVGLRWGGRWKAPDVSHFQLDGGRPMSQVRRDWEAERSAPY